MSSSYPPNFTSADIYLAQGDTFYGTVTVMNSDGTIPDLTDWAVAAQLRIGAADYSPPFVEFFIIFTPPNIYTLILDNVTSSALCYEHFVWDMQLTTPDGLYQQTVLGGYANITLEVTRSGAMPFGTRPVLTPAQIPSHQPRWSISGPIPSPEQLPAYQPTPGSPWVAYMERVYGQSALETEEIAATRHAEKQAARDSSE